VIIMAIDPGNVFSGIVVFNTSTENILKYGKFDNYFVNRFIEANHSKIDCFVFEMIASYGMAGKTVFDTCVWIGRFIQNIETLNTNKPWYRVVRSKVAAHILDKKKKGEVVTGPKSKDSRIRLKMIEYFGETKTKGISKDAWQALALAKYFMDKHKAGEINDKDYKC